MIDEPPREAAAHRLEAPRVADVVQRVNEDPVCGRVDD